MTREEVIHELQEDKRLYETEVCHAGDGSPDGRLLEALDMAIEALSAESETLSHEEAWKQIEGDLISRAEVHKTLSLLATEGGTDAKMLLTDAHEFIDTLPSAEAVQGWIPCSERLPKELEAVNVTWVNHNPPVYYQHIKDVPKADTAVYYSNAWYWWDATVIDLLGEYGGAYVHGIEPIDKDIEVTAWMPLPKPYKGGAE